MNAESTYWEAIADRHEKEWKKVWGSNEETGPLVYWRDVVPYRHLVKLCRIQEGQPVCFGAVDCLSKNITTCAAGKHQSCKEHANTCMMCKESTNAR